VRQKGVIKLLLDLFERWPRRCIRVAARMGESMEGHLVGWIVANPAAARAMAAEDPALATVIDALSGPQRAALPDAELDSLHPLFRDPPWARGARRAARPITVALEPLLPPVRAVLLPDEQALAADAEKRMDAWVAAGWLHDRRRRHGDSLWHLYEVVHGDDEVVRVAGEAIAQEWGWSRDREWLGYGMVALAPARASAVLIAASKERPSSAPVLCALASPAAASFFPSALGTKTWRSLAVSWAERHPEYASRAWIPVALGRAMKPRELAERGLRAVARAGHEPVLRGIAAEYGAAATAGVEALLAVDRLDTLPRPVPKSIAFLVPAALPRPRLRDRDAVLPLPSLPTLANIFAISTQGEPYAGVEVAKAMLEPASPAETVWEITQQWFRAGAPSEHSWALGALGLAGNDDVATRLAPVIRAWPGELQH
jgi:hypothetical protein